MPDFGSPEYKTLSSSQPLIAELLKKEEKETQTHTQTEIYGLSYRLKKLHAYVPMIIVVDCCLSEEQGLLV